MSADLAISTNFRISHDYESAILIRKDQPDVIIGDFYGDPEVALIDAEERWCAVAGCGLIVYFLKKPYIPYRYDQHTEQYFEVGRKQTDLWWVSAIEQTGPFSIRVSCDNGVQHQLSFSQYAECCVSVPSLQNSSP